MAVVARSPGQVSRNRFMIAVMGGVGTVIGLIYVGIVLRFLYPKSSDTPPLDVQVGPDGVTPQGSATMPWQNGVAGPFYYPTVPDKSVVVGIFVAKENATGPLTTNNIRVVEQTCTHLGCPVSWVAGDNKYECPCHGSQFNRDLSVAHGPASDPLHAHNFRLAGNTLTILGRKN